jgi:RimJ/RimL family protein N-acetyltransferase
MLKGQTVVLRPVEERDLDLLARWRNDPDNRQFFFSTLLIYPAGQKKWFDALIADPSRLLLIIENREGKPVGMIGLGKIDARNQECEGGPVIVAQDERQYGYAEEAIELLLKYAFEELNMNRFYCYCYPFNHVVELMKMFGFKEEGVLRQAVFTQGQFHDKVLLALLREEWENEHQ